MEAPIVLDNGGHNLKIGMGGNEDPDQMIRSIIALDDDCLVGNIVEEKGLSFTNPIERGMVLDWDRMEKVWQHAFTAVNYDPSQHAVLVTEAILNPARNREAILQSMFETFGVPYSYVALDPVLSVYSSGRGSALAVDSGDGVSQVLPVCEGRVFAKAVYRADFGGSDLTLYLMKLLEERQELSFNFSEKRKIVNKMKEKLCTLESGTAVSMSYDLPDGSTILLNNEAQQTANIIIDPSPICGENEPAITDIVLKSIRNIEPDFVKDFFANIFLSGGNCKLKGFSEVVRERVKEEFKSSELPDFRFRAIAPDEMIKSCWIGGSILSSLSTFRSFWVTSQEFDDFGTAIVHRKCTN